MILFYGCNEMITTNIPEFTLRTNRDTFEPEMFYKGAWRRVERVVDEHIRTGDTVEDPFGRHKYIIPASLLVQTFMRKLRDGMDRS